MPVIDRLAVEIGADLQPLRLAFAEAERMAGTAAGDLAAALAPDGDGAGVFGLLLEGAETAGRAIQDALADAIGGAEVEWDQVLSRMALRLSDLVLDQALQQAVGNLGGGGTATDLPGLLSSLFGGFRVGGGPVAPNRAYVVGEAGPELFVPGAAGAIVPNGAAAPAPTVIVNITTPDVAGFRQSQGQVAAAMARALGSARRYS